MSLFGAPVLRNKVVLFWGDVCVVLLAVYLSLALRFPTDGGANYFYQHEKHFIVLGVVTILCFYIADLYDLKKDFRRLENILPVAAASFSAMVISIVLLYSRLNYIGRGIFLLYGIIVFLLATFMRSAYISLNLKKQWKKRALIVGAGNAGTSLLNTILANDKCGIWAVGFIDDDPEKSKEVYKGKTVLGTSADLLRLVRDLDIDLIVISVTNTKNTELIKTLIRCHHYNIEVTDMPTVFESITGKIPIYHINDEWLLRSAMSNQRVAFRKVKRLIDIVSSLILLTLTSPLLLFGMAAVRLGSEGGIFFTQDRVGRDFIKFRIYKLRTMYKDADGLAGPTSAKENDPRITKVGRIIRRLRVDEIPQLFNVLKGDMSLVGPRPDIELFVNELDKELPSYSYRLMVKPGLTGWAQVMYKYSSTKDEFVEKLRYDLYYIKNMSMMLDLLILLKTVRIVLLSKGH
jgi:exopolysaccharide biosynthesis polyprenyl glycosylphosphotransferase